MTNTVVEIGEVLDMASVKPLQETLRDALALGNPVTVNAASLQRIDGAGIQLLTAFCRDASSAGMMVSWKGVTESMLNAAKYLGVDQILGLSKQVS